MLAAWHAGRVVFEQGDVTCVPLPEVGNSRPELPETLSTLTIPAATPHVMPQREMERSLNTSNAFWTLLTTQCVCAAGAECEEHVGPDNSVRLCKRHEDKERARQELRLLRSPISAEELKRIMSSTVLYKLRVHVHHFESGHINWSAGKLMRKPHKGGVTYISKLPRGVKDTELTEKDTGKRRWSTGSDARAEEAAKRAKLQEFGCDPSAETLRLAERVLELEKREEELRASLAEARMPSREAVRETTVANCHRLLELDPTLCRSMTGMPSFKCVKLMFAYVNADGVLDSIALWRGRQTKAQPGAQGRTRSALSTFDSFLLFLIVHRTGHHGIARLSLAVDKSTASRHYFSMLRAVGFVLSVHQPWATHEAAVTAVPEKMRDELQAHEAAAVFIGDATERRVNNLRFAHLFNMWSGYKGDCTAKVNAVCLPNGYMTDISPCYPGAAKDGRLMGLDGLPQRMQTCADGGRSVYLYDRGLTSGAQAFFDRGTVVLTPRTKQTGQIGFSVQSADTNRKVASNRVMIEHLFGNARAWAAFDGRFSLRMVDVADAVNEVTRCLINFLCPPHDWHSLVSQAVAHA